MPIVMSIAVKRETMHSSKVFSDALFVCARIASETIPSEVAMVMVILSTEDNDNENDTLKEVDPTIVSGLASQA